MNLFSYVLLDRSGSMSALWDDTLGGLETYVQDQADADGDAYITLHAFDTAHDTVFEAYNARDVAVRDALKLVHPRGATALYDAIGLGVLQMQRLLDARPWFDGVRQFVVQTDGAENSSVEYSLDAVRALIAEREADGWEFYFMGANIDAFGEASGLGINLTRTVQYDNATVGNAYRTLSANTLSSRS